MAKIGVTLKIDVSKIDKARLFKGQKGTYLDATVFIDADSPSQFGDHGMITQDVSKDERAQGVKGEIIGNVKVFWTEGQQAQPQQPAQRPQQSQPAQGSMPEPVDDFIDDIPF